MPLLVALFGFVLFAVGSALVIGLVIAIDRSDCSTVSGAWIRERRALELRTVVSVDHELVAPDGTVLARNTDEKTLRAVRRELESLQ